MNTVEEEVVLLKAVVDLIDSIVNFEIFDLLGIDPDSNILFHAGTHQKYFNLVLADFLSKTDKRAPVTQKSYLAGLRAIGAAPSFDVNGSVELLRDSTAAFTRWLEEKVEVDIWMPSIERQEILKVTRFTFLKMCGDLCKHNFLRAVGVAEELRAILEKSGVVISVEESLLGFEDFYQRFHDDSLTITQVRLRSFSTISVGASTSTCSLSIIAESCLTIRRPRHRGDTATRYQAQSLRSSRKRATGIF